jgi:hypothetical protein
MVLRWINTSACACIVKSQTLPGALPPDPRHFSLFTNSIVGEQGDAPLIAASPMLLDCGGARGACRPRGFPNAIRRVWGPSPILHSSRSRLHEMHINSRGPVAGKSSETAHYSDEAAMPHFLAIMLLAQSGKCRGLGGGAPRKSLHTQAGWPGAVRVSEGSEWARRRTRSADGCPYSRVKLESVSVMAPFGWKKTASSHGGPDDQERKIYDDSKV